jgi:hypothetical protein
MVINHTLNHKKMAINNPCYPLLTIVKTIITHYSPLEIYGSSPRMPLILRATARLSSPHEVSSFGTEALLLHLVDVEHRGTTGKKKSSRAALGTSSIFCVPSGKLT